MKTGMIILEDQDQRAVGIWSPEMEAFDRLPKIIRDYLNQMIMPPLASSVLAAYEQYGTNAALTALREVNMQDAINMRVA
jgi:hypothetical protein